MQHTLQRIIKGIWTHFLNGITIAPVKAIVLYMILNIIDIYLTWLVTPDLKYEVNWMILLFGFGWKFIIWREIIVDTVLIIGLIISMSIIQIHYRQNKTSEKSIIREIFGSFKIFLCFFIMISIFIDLFYSLLLIVPSNYLQYLFVHKIQNFWTGLSNLYVNNLILPHPLFTRLMYPVFAVAGILYTLYLVWRIKQAEQKN